MCFGVQYFAEQRIVGFQEHVNNSSSPPPKGHKPSIFGPYLLRPNVCMDQDVTWYGARPRPRRLSVRWGSRCPFPKRGANPQNFRPTFIVTNGWMDEADTWRGGRPQPRRVCVRWGPSRLRQKGQSPSPILRVEVENFEIGPEVRALQVIALTLLPLNSREF